MIRFLAAFLLLLAFAVPAPGPASAQMQLDLREVELNAFVQLVSEQTQRNFLMDPDISATVTVHAPQPVSPSVMLEIFINVLEMNGLTIIEGAGIDRIVQARRASEQSPAPGAAGGPGSFETRVIPVESGQVSEVYDVIHPLIPRTANLTPIQEAGLLVLSDRRENIDRIEALVQRLARHRDHSVEQIRLNHARASELVPVIEGVVAVPSGARISADARANAIVISGPESFRTRIRNIIGQLDSPQQRSVSRVVPLSYADASELAEVVRESTGLAEEGEALITVVAEPRSNAILINAPPDRADSIAAAIRQLDTRPAQVLVEAVVFEISAENFSDLSVQFGGILNDAIGGGTSFDIDGRASLITLISAAMRGDTRSPGSGGMLGGTDQRSFAALIGAIARERSTRLLSTPAVLTLNNQQAEIVVAQNVPFVTGRFATVGDSAVPDQPFQTIERQDVGLTLEVRPQITRDGTVRMAIRQEVSNLTGTTAAAGGEVTARRRLSTNALVGDGQVIILGGLIEDSARTNSERVPGLSNLPVLGTLFRGRNVQEGQRVLLVMLRPRVISSDREAERLTREIARKTERISREISPRNDTRLYPQVRRTGFPFDGVDLNQPFESTYVDRAVRDRLFPALPPRLMVDTGQ